MNAMTINSPKELRAITAFRSALLWKQKAAVAFLEKNDKLRDGNLFNITVPLRYDAATHTLEVIPE